MGLPSATGYFGQYPLTLTAIMRSFDQSFHKPDALPVTQPRVSKHWRTWSQMNVT